MKLSRFFPFITLVLLIALFLWAFFFRSAAHVPERSDIPLPAFEMDLLSGKGAFTNEALHNHVSVVNLFASWCTPCKEEMPLLADLKKRSNIPIYGIAWRDKPETLNKWLKETGNPFTRVGLDNEGKLVIALGVTGVPETYIIDKKQRIIFRHAGPITEDIINNKMLPLINALHNEP